MYRITLSIIFCLAVSANAAFYSCGSSSVGYYKNINVSDCPSDANICILKRGGKVTIEIEFYLNEDVKELKSVVHGVIGGAPLPFPISHPNACESSGLTCPLAKGSTYIYKTSLNVESYYPKLKVDVKWELKTPEMGKDESVICIMIPSKLQ